MLALKRYWIVVVYCAVVGLLFALAVPPFQKPDENRHYYQASAISRGNLLCQKDEQGKVATRLPESVLSFPTVLKTSEIAHTPHLKFTPEMFQLYRYPEADQEGIERTWCSYSPIGYIPNSLGLLIGRVSGSLMVEFYASRILALAIFLGAIAAALIIAPSSYRRCVVVFACIPMTLHQVSSVSYDVLTLILTPLLFASMMKIWRQPDSHRRYHFLFEGSLLLIILSKPAYIPLLLLNFLVYKPTRALLVSVLGAVVALPFLKPSFFVEIPNGVDASVQKQLIVQDPLHFLQAMWFTINTDIQALYEGFIGNFGWLDYHLHYAAYLIVPAVVSWVVLGHRSHDHLTNSKVGVLALTIGAAIAAVFASLYAMWTPVGAYFVGGVQGRYFLILTPFVLLLVGEIVERVRSNKSMQTLLAIGAVIVFTVHIAASIYSRYYDYAKAGINDPDISTAIGKIEVRKIDRYYETKATLPASRVKVAGFYYHLASSRLPTQYRYRIMNSACTDVLREGYLKSIYEKSGQGLYTEKISPFWVDEDTLCISLEPLAGTGTFLELVTKNGETLYPLYIVTSLR